MHYRAKIIANSEVGRVVYIEVVPFLRIDIVNQNVNVRLPILTRVLMPQTKRMADLMRYDADLK